MPEQKSKRETGCTSRRHSVDKLQHRSVNSVWYSQGKHIVQFLGALGFYVLTTELTGQNYHRPIIDTLQHPNSLAMCCIPQSVCKLSSEWSFPWLTPSTWAQITVISQARRGWAWVLVQGVFIMKMLPTFTTWYPKRRGLYQLMKGSCSYLAYNSLCHFEFTVQA